MWKRGEPMVFRSIISRSCEAVPLRAFFEDYFCEKESEMLNILIKAMYGDPEAVESWEEHCFWRDEEFRRSDELKRITHLLSTIFDTKSDLGQEDSKARISANKRRIEQLSQRQPQGDVKSTRLAAVMPVPPMISMKGGQFYTQGIGV